ncbi:hypothetical protein [Leeuwenhoekiella sp. NPDC079379]|uniref:hypothetical protein n=1 Tax=Leeuwenhoekiella sp. NPDC079379 TaxID=3364122 RepID=UPI0037C8883C
MIDFLKIWIYDIRQIEILYTSPLLVWSGKNEKLLPDLESIKTVVTKTYEGIIFNFDCDKLEILFKPHYYFNGNKHNANDFTIKDFLYTLNYFQQILNLDLNLCFIMNIEFGVNIISPICIKDLINYIKYHLKNEFLCNAGLSYSKFSTSTNKKGILNVYKIIKAYAQGLQHPKYCDINTFRFEIKSNRTDYIQSTLGVNTLQDLTILDPFLKMKSKIIEEFENVLILDIFANPILNLTEQKKFEKLLNCDSWYHFKQHKDRNKFSKNKKIYLNLIARDNNNLHLTILNSIKDKLCFLTKGAILSPPIKS